MNKFPKKFIISVLKLTIIGILFSYLLKHLIVGWNEVSSHSFQILYHYLLLSLFVLFIYYLLVPLAWRYIVARLGSNCDYLASVYIWLVSQLTRYAPGPWQYITRIYLCERQGISKKVSSVSLILESAISIVAIGLIASISLVIFPGFLRQYGNYDWGVLIVIGGLLTIIHPKIFLRSVNITLRLMKKEAVHFVFGFAHILKIIVSLSLVSVLVLGFAFYLFVNSISPVRPDHIAPVISSFFVAQIVSLLAIFVPAGLGVREAVLSLLLSQFFGTSIAILIALSSRLWLVVGQLLSTGVVGVIYWIRKAEA